MSRPPKPAKLMAISGALANHPERKRKDAVATGAIGPWVKRSTDPKKVWDELVSVIPAGVLASADRVGLEICVRLLVEMRKAPAAFTAGKASTLVGLLRQFGCLPAARFQMNPPEVKTNEDPGENFFR
jgi:hypothetical protein